MSYALTLYGRRLALGAGAGTSASANVQLVAALQSGSQSKNTAEAAAATAQAAAAITETELPDCEDAAVTGNSYIDSTFVECCKSIKKNWDLSLAQKAKGITECAARGVATGACVAAGVVTAGISTALAPLCGAVAGFVANRVMGYDTAQIVAGVTAAAVCGALSGGTLAAVCGFAAAELIGWVSDTLGPIVEGIFNPSAAADRELAARRASHALIDATEDVYRKADLDYKMLWANGINSLRDLYNQAFTTEAQRARARKILGFVPVYDDLAKQMVKAGAVATPEEWIAEFLSSQLANKGPGCSHNDYVNPKTNTWDPYSKVCPLSLEAYYTVSLRDLIARGKKSRDDRNAFERQIIVQLRQFAEAVYPLTAQAISSVASAITMAAITIKQEELLAAAKAATLSQLANRAATAASRSEAAADAALKGNAKESARAVVRAKQQYEIAVAASRLLLESMGSTDAQRALACVKDASCMKAQASVKRALLAMMLAKKNAATAARNRVMFGGLLAAGAAGAAYLLLRK